MAKDYEPTQLSRRIADARARRGITGAELAELIPDPAFTRSVVANIESGRKSDPAISEILKIASALKMSPLELLIDVRNPWGDLGEIGEGLAEPFASMSVAEYYLAAKTTHNTDLNNITSSFVTQLHLCETTAFRIEVIEQTNFDDWEIHNPESMTLEVEYMTPLGERVALPVLSDYDATLFDAEQGLVDQYRDLLFFSEVEPWNKWREKYPIPASIRDRIEALRLIVVELISKGDFDYGQNDEDKGYGAPPLDPKTAKLVRRVRGLNESKA